MNESTGGNGVIFDDGEAHVTYSVNGILKDLPNDVNDYNLTITLYDKNGTLINESEGVPMETIAKHSEDSQPSILGTISIDEFVNVSFAEIKIYNSDEEVVFDENVTFHMENVIISHTTKDTLNNYHPVDNTIESNDYNDDVSDDSDDEYHSDWLDHYFDEVSRSGLDKDN